MAMSKWLNNLRLRTKFLLILLIAMSLVFGSMFALLQIPYSSYDDQLYKSSVQTITLFVEKIQAELKDIEELSYRILADNVLQKNLSVMKKRLPGTFAWVEAKSEINDRMSYFGIWFTSAITFQLKTADGAFFSQSFGWASTADELTPERIALAAENQGRETWLAEEGPPVRLYLLRSIREIEGLTLDILATTLIEMNLSGVVNKYLQNVSQLSSPLSCAIYSGDTCLYASDAQVGSLSSRGDDGYVYMQLDGQEVLCVRYTAPNGWRYVTLVDYSKINDTISTSVRISTGVGILAMVLALALGAWLISTLLAHLARLVNKFDDFASTGHPVAEEDDTYLLRQDEIGQLHRHFDKMTRDYDAMIRDRNEQQRLLQETRMQQLRAQVRPHFLYNTLESIYCLAKDAEDERIATMTDALGKLLRATLNDKRDIVTVAEDLQITREYLRIQLIRYGDRLRVEYDLDDAFMACELPAMTLQPLVENAVHHALEEMLDFCIIRIGARPAGDGIEITVEDNGPGVDEDILLKLESGEIRPEGLGIGMRNIHRRVQYAFGNAYGLRVQSAPGHTCIVVHLPGTRGAYVRDNKGPARPEGKNHA